MTPEFDVPTELRLAGEIDRLVAEFHGSFDRATVEECVRTSAAQLRGSHVGAYVVSIAGRFAKERLRAMGQANGSIAKHVPEILFVTARDAARSQMAVAFVHVLGNGRVSARSGGTNPAHAVQAEVLDAMTEADAGLDAPFAKPLTDEVVHAADVVVTMGCDESTCPYYPGKSYRAWEVENPEGKSLDEVRAIRDTIRSHVTRLLAEMGALTTAPL